MLLFLFYLLYGVRSQSIGCQPSADTEVSTDASYTISWGKKWSWPNGVYFNVYSEGAAGFYLASTGTMVVGGNGQEDECYWIVLLAGGGVFDQSEISYVCQNWNDREVMDSDNQQRVFPASEEGNHLFYIDSNPDGTSLQVAQVDTSSAEWVYDYFLSYESSSPPGGSIPRDQVGISTEAGSSGIWYFCNEDYCAMNGNELCDDAQCVNEAFSYSCVGEGEAEAQEEEAQEEEAQEEDAEEDAQEEVAVETPPQTPPSPSPTESPTPFDINVADCLSPNSLDITWDFESGDLKGWTSYGTAFASRYQPVEANQRNNEFRLAYPAQEVHEQGNWWIGSYNKGSADIVCLREAGGCQTVEGDEDKKEYKHLIVGMDSQTATDDDVRRCLLMCLDYPGATGCEITDGCYANIGDAVLDKGTAVGKSWEDTSPHSCFIFSKCTRAVDVLHANAECGTSEIKNLGPFEDPVDCAFSVISDNECTENTFMYSHEYPSWGCRCCTNDYPNGPVENDVCDVYTFSERNDWEERSTDVACEGNGEGRDSSCDGDLDCCKASMIEKGFSYVVWWRDMCYGSSSCDATYELTGTRNYYYRESKRIILEHNMGDGLNDQSLFNQYWKKGVIICRICPGCQESHKTICYKRLTTPTSGATDGYTLFLASWVNNGNILGTDFELYSSVEDAKKGQNKWTYCNYHHGVGFPRDCGPTGYVPHQWNSRTGGKAVTYWYHGFGGEEETNDRWLTLYEKDMGGNMDDPSLFNQYWHKDAIICRTCLTCADSHKTICYKRLTEPTDTAANGYILFTTDWFSGGNSLGVDFELYSSLDDAKNGENKWTFCNYNDPGIGFPRDCGPTGYVANQWNSVARGGHAVTYWTDIMVAEVTLYEKNLGNNVNDQPLFNRYWKQGAIICRTCPSCANSHQTICYKRLTPPAGDATDGYILFTTNWFSVGNALNVDFELYSSLNDAKNGQNKWTFCNYNDPGIGFPRDCGPTNGVGGQWNSVARGGHAVRYWTIDAQYVESTTLGTPCNRQYIIKTLKECKTAALQLGFTEVRDAPPSFIGGCSSAVNGGSILFFEPNLNNVGSEVNKAICKKPPPKKLEAEVLHENHECGTSEIKNLGIFSTEKECAVVAEQDADCASNVFMWCDSGECRCCDTPDGPVEHDLWDVYDFPFGDAIDTAPANAWVKGPNGQDCNQVCGDIGMVCDADSQSSLTTNEDVAAAFLEAGYTCKSFHDPRNYAGTPFSTNRDGDDCAPVIAGSYVGCSGNSHGHHSRLCKCVQTPACVTTGGSVAANTACTFPFTYEGQTYWTCTKHNHHVPWCSIDTVYNGRWGNCECGTEVALDNFYSFIGCFVDDGNRDLQDGPMQYGYTQPTCNAACKDYKYWALQNGGWCVCGNDYATEPQYSQVADSECGATLLGSGWRNAIYTHGVEEKKVDSTPSGYAYVGCFRDNSNRDLDEGPRDYGYTSETCHTACAQYGFFSLQNGGQCFCGNDYGTSDAYSQVVDSECGSDRMGRHWRNAIFRNKQNSGTEWLPLTSAEITASTSYDNVVYIPDRLKMKYTSPWHDRGSGVNQWLVFKFPQSVTIDGFRTRAHSGWDGSAFKDYKFEVSQDGQNWDPIKIGQGINQDCCDFQEITVPTTSSIYWRLYMVNSWGYPALSIEYMEFRFIEKRLGDRYKGRLISDEFCINHGTIGMLVGGGCHYNNTYVSVAIAGVPHDKFKATGKCHESMVYREFDVTEYVGQKARIKIVDDSTANWGHINVDDIVFFWQGFDKLRYLNQEVPCITPRYVETSWNFESGQLDGWTIKGGRGAFADQPINLNPFGHTSNHEGKHWIGTSAKEFNRPQGFLVSQEFCITEGSISMLVGGPDKSGVALVLSDTHEIVEVGYGKNTDSMSYNKWDVTEYMNKMAYIKIFDFSSSTEWGHVNVDNFQFFWDGFEMNFYSSWCLQTTMPEHEIKLNDEMVTKRCIGVAGKNPINLNGQTVGMGDLCDLCSTQPFIDSLIQGYSGLVFTLPSLEMSFIITLSGDGNHMSYGIPDDRGNCINPGFTTSYSIVVGGGNLMIKESGTGSLRKSIVIPYQVGDQCSIEVRKGKLVYTRNGNVLYQSGMSIKLPINYKVIYDKRNDDMLYLCPLKFTPKTRACIPPEEIPTSWDFEQGLTGWSSFKEGTAFDFQPTYGDNPTARNRGQPSNHQGNYWIGGYEQFQNDGTTSPGAVQGDGPVGGIRSMKFCVTQNRVSFLIGGGDSREIRYVRMVIDGETALNGLTPLKATGHNHETMRYEVWDTSNLVGQIAQIEIVDQSSGGWGHINVDDFRFWGDCATVFNNERVTCSQLRTRDDCLSHRNPNHLSNCALCVDEDGNQTPCLDKNGNRFSNNAFCLSQGWSRFNPQNNYVIASCEAGSYLGPLDAFPRGFTVIGDEIAAVSFTLGTSDIGTWPTSPVKCCLDYDGMRTADIVPVGADTCCWRMDQARTEQTIHFQTKKDFFDLTFSGTVAAVCNSDDPAFCGLKKVLSITGRANPPPPATGRECRGTGDPHYSDFFGTWFDWQAKANLWFVRTLDSEWNVQTRTKCCTPWGRGTCRVTCSEAVAVTFRKEKISLNIPPPGGACQVFSNAKLITLKQHGNWYVTTTNKGAIAKAQYSRNGNFAYFNVYASTIADYAGNMAPMSLCGDGQENRNSGENFIPKRNGKDDRFTVDPALDFFYNEPDWEPPTEEEGGVPPSITVEPCEDQLANNICEPTCCSCDSDPDCAINFPDLKCCDPVCPQDDICCENPERCCIGDDCVPEPFIPPQPCYEPPVFPCYDLTSDRRLLMETPCCYKEMPTDDKSYSMIAQNDPPEGFTQCCGLPDNCAKQCAALFEIDSLTAILERPGCDCEIIQTTIDEQHEACLIDGGAMGCKIVGELIAPTVTTIIEITLDKCREEFGPACDPICPVECDLMGPNIIYHQNEENNLCWCECDKPYFGPRCLREGSPYCTNAIFSDVSGVVTLEGDFLYEGDALMCVFTMVGEDYQSAAVGVSDSVICDGTQPNIGERLCRYTQLQCDLPSDEWIAEKYNSFRGATISIKIQGTTINPNEDSISLSLGSNCEYTPRSTCRDLVTAMGWPESNPCNERNSEWQPHNLDEEIDAESDNYDHCCSDTPPPTPSPTPHPTNSPTWPAHIVVPVLELHTPWYFDFTPPPTASTMDYDVAPTPGNVYIPAQRGSMREPYCLGFGDECLPIYGQY